MTQVFSPAQRAEGKIKMAVARLSEHYPFHAKVLEQFKVRVMPGLETMGVSVLDSDLMLLYNLEFVLETPADQMVGVSHHEVLHVVFDHVLADPKDFPDE